MKNTNPVYAIEEALGQLGRKLVSADINDIVQMTVKPIRDEKKFVASTIPYTPVDLINEIFDNIPPIVNRETDANIAVLFTVEMAIVLRLHKFNNVTIITDKHCPFVQCYANDWGLEYILMDEIDMNRKFDVVVGNPPYQSEKNTNARTKLWPLFIKSGFALAKNEGYVGMITPKDWVNNDTLYSTYFLNYNPIVLNIEQCKHFFPTVSSTISYFVVQKSCRTDNTTVTVITPSSTFQLNEMPVYGVHLGSKVAIQLLNRMLQNISFFEMITSSGYNTSGFSKNDPTLSLEPTTKHTVPVLKSIKTNGRVYVYSSKIDHSLAGKWRVISSTWLAQWGDFIISDTLMTTQDFRHFPTNTEIECVNLSTVLSSKLYTFIMKSLAATGRLTNKAVSYFPKVDLTRSWTDEELYHHFNLTDEEIELIEQTIK